MKTKKLIIDTVVVMASISLLSCIVLILSHNLMVYGIVSYSFDMTDITFMEAMEKFSAGTTTGNVGVMGIIISILTLGIMCFVAFYQTRNGHYFLGVGLLIPLLLSLIPLIVSTNVGLNIIASMSLLLYANPFFTLFAILPIKNMTVSVYVGFAIVTLLVALSTVAGILYNKFKVKLD